VVDAERQLRMGTQELAASAEPGPAPEEPAAPPGPDLPPAPAGPEPDGGFPG